MQNLTITSNLTQDRAEWRKAISVRRHKERRPALISEKGDVKLAGSQEASNTTFSLKCTIFMSNLGYTFFLLDSRFTVIWSNNVLTFTFTHSQRYIITAKWKNLMPKKLLDTVLLSHITATQPAITCSKLRIETLEEGVKCVPSKQ